MLWDTTYFTWVLTKNLDLLMNQSWDPPLNYENFQLFQLELFLYSFNMIRNVDFRCQNRFWWWVGVISHSTSDQKRLPGPEAPTNELYFGTCPASIWDDFQTILRPFSWFCMDFPTFFNTYKNCIVCFWYWTVTVPGVSQESTNFVFCTGGYGCDSTVEGPAWIVQFV